MTNGSDVGGGERLAGIAIVGGLATGFVGLIGAFIASFFGVFLDRLGLFYVAVTSLGMAALAFGLTAQALLRR